MRGDYEYTLEEALENEKAEKAWWAQHLRDMERNRDALRARERGECGTCGYAPCMCDQQ